MFRILSVLALLAATAAYGSDTPISPPHTVLTGSTFTYIVRPADTLTSVSARFGVTNATLLWLNGLPPKARLRPGDALVVSNRHIAVLDAATPLVLNVAQRMIFFTDRGGTTAYPVAVGLRTWPTPRGRFTIIEKESNPAWDVPLSIQEEMRQQGKPVITRVPPGPDNPLGAHFLRLSFPAVGIHGTNGPATVFRFASHGCIRMHPDDIAALFSRTEVGMAGVSVYEPVLLAVDGGAIVLEVHPDVYRRGPPPLAHVQSLAAAYGVSTVIDWAHVADEIRLARGIAVDVRLSTASR
jgi:L,D-transpeptidase ErfK/SrfK